jgi:Uma2 family endonuclease
MAQNTLAPWAELVPDAGPTTVDELLARPEDAWRYELVEGRLVRMPPTGGGHAGIAGTLIVALGTWVLPRRLGRVLASEAGFQLGPGTVLAPDVAYVRASNVPAPDSPDRERFWPLAPDLIAEVASPGQTQAEMDAKARAWLAAGVRLAWVIWPRSQRVDVWQADAQGVSKRVAILGQKDALDGLEVLPGFTFPVADLFA